MSMYDLTQIRNWLIPLILITSSISLPTSAQDEHTVLLYSFETVRGFVIQDLSDSGNDGTLLGAKRGDGKFQGGMIFGGNEDEDYVEIPDDDSLDLVEGLTIEMWVYLNSEPTAGGVGVTKATTYKVGPRNNLKTELRMATTTNAWGSANVISNSQLPLGKWVHIAATYDADSGDGLIYIDGEIDNEKNIGGEIVKNDIVIWLGRGGNPFLDGSLDEVRISNIARTQKEIQQLMNTGIEVMLAVTPRDKLATTWGQLKSIIVDN